MFMLSSARAANSAKKSRDGPALRYMLPESCHNTLDGRRFVPAYPKTPPLIRLACALGLIFLFVLPAAAQLQDERSVKTAFVFNLTKYVEWPHATNELVIGFVGDAPMGEILKKMLDGKTSDSRPIRVLLFPSEEQLEHCNLLYIAHSSPKETRAALDRVHKKGILTVGETESFARDGGMIGLVRTGDQVLIQVNLQAAQESQLKISSRLLNLSIIVQRASGERN